MKKMSQGEQLKCLRSKRRALLEKKDLSMKGRMAAQEQAVQKVKKKKPIIVTIYER